MDSCDAVQQDLEAALASPAACGTGALLAARDRSRALGEPACASPNLALHGLKLPGTPPARPRQAPPLPAEKTTRDVLAPVLSTYETPNFAVRYGPGIVDADASLLRIGSAFEDAWAQEIAGMGYPAPNGSESYKFNVYVGDTDNGAPESYGTSGYYYVDDAGYGYIVVSLATVADPEWLRITAAHEFFHALQDAAATYPYEGQGAWYWESGACFIEGVVVPESDDNSAFLAAFSLLPDLPVNYFLYPDGTLPSLHQYGAFLFLQHLVEVTEGGDPTLLRRSWLEATPTSDPMTVLDGLLQEQGDGTLADAFADMAARESTFDWDDEAAYEASIEAWGGFDAPGSTRPSGFLYGASGSPIGPPDPPHTFGRNHWQVLSAPAAFDLRFLGVDGPDWRVTVSTQTGEVHSHTDVPVSANTATQRITGVESADEVWITVSAAAGPIDDGTQYDYTLTLVNADDTDAPDTDEERRACSCASLSAGPLGMGWLLTGLAAYVVSARRRSARGI